MLTSGASANFQHETGQQAYVLRSYKINGCHQVSLKSFITPKEIASHSVAHFTAVSAVVNFSVVRNGHANCLSKILNRLFYVLFITAGWQKSISVETKC